MKILERREDSTFWIGKDPEGRTVYASTMDRNGVPVEPVPGEYYYSLSAAILHMIVNLRKGEGGV